MGREQRYRPEGRYVPMMAESIVIDSAGRPEDDDNWTPPTYWEMLGYLCDELRIPGAPTFEEAIKFVKGKVKMQAERLQQYRRVTHMAGNLHYGEDL